MFEVVLISWLVVFCFICLIWAWHLYLKNPSLIDACWPIGILISGSVYITLQYSQTAIDFKIVAYWVCFVIWALRLSGFLWLTRIKKNEIDKRYLELSSTWKMKKSLGFFLQYQFQGILMIVVSLPFLFIGSDHSTLSWFDFIVISFVVLCIIFESIADYQLYAFKKDHPGKVCNQGLWKYSRHPNYFFEWLIWIGFAVGAVHSTLSCLSFISPILLIYLFAFVTGPITERSSIKSRGHEYLTYQKKTSMIIPWFVKPNS